MIKRRARQAGSPAEICAHSFGAAADVPLPTIAAVLGYADLSTTAIYTTTIGAEAREFIARVWG